MPMSLKSLLIAALLLGHPVYGDPPLRFERLLFPLVVNQLNGAFGTVWSTEIVVRNEGMQPVEIFRSECYFRCRGSDCVFTFCSPGQPTAPHTRYTGGLGDPNFTLIPAAMLHVERQYADSVVASLRLIEETRRANEYGVEIPVVRDHELFTTSLWLPDVPVPVNGRTHLRIYGVESDTGEAHLRVMVYEGDDAIPAAEFDTYLLPPPFRFELPRPDNFDEDVPGYMFLDLSRFAESATSLRVRIDPLTPGLKFWAMASVTSNETQHVTLVTPQ